MYINKNFFIYYSHYIFKIKKYFIEFVFSQISAQKYKFNLENLYFSPVLYKILHEFNNKCIEKRKNSCASEYHQLQI